MAENDADNGSSDGASSQREAKVNPLHDLIAGGVAGSASVIVGRELPKHIIMTTLSPADAAFASTFHLVSLSLSLSAVSSSFLIQSRSFRHDKGTHSNLRRQWRQRQRRRWRRSRTRNESAIVLPIPLPGHGRAPVLGHARQRHNIRFVRVLHANVGERLRGG